MTSPYPVMPTRRTRTGWRALAAPIATLALVLGLASAVASPAHGQDSAGRTAQPAANPTGWASQNGGTTGGAGGSTVTVTSGSELTQAMLRNDPLTIRVQGTLSCSGMHNITSNKTVIGIGSNAAIVGCGINVNRARNVVIRNLNFRNFNDDAVNVENGSTNVWVDHNTFSNGYDGAVDIKRESDFVTVSWNRFFNHDKTMLLGHSDSHTADIGRLRVTYHHNFFDGTNTRHPRVRFSAHTHVFNNYYRNNREYGVASTMNANVLVEGNYFQNLRNPTHVGYAASGPGNLVARNNVHDNSGSAETRGSVPNPPYAYSVTNPNSIPAIVSGGAGAGNI